MPHTKRLLKALAACGLLGALLVPAASASTTQQAVMQDNGQLTANPVSTINTMRELGVSQIKFAIYWNQYAPNATSTSAPKGFNGSNPASYAASKWSTLDTIMRYAAAAGIKVGFQVTGPAPRWAEGPDLSAAAKSGQWKPNDADYKAFVEALGTRYSGTYKPSGATSALPRVSWWSVWNEPNYGPDLAPQGIDNNTVFEGAILYRGLVNAAWQGLHATGHGSDTFLLGETAPRGVSGRGLPGIDGGTKPLQFIATLYCATTSGKRLTGATARANGCPSSAGAFRSQNPALFSASGFADHPYSQGDAPNMPTYACVVNHTNTFCWNSKTKKSDPLYADFAEIPRLEKTLDHVNSLYGSGKKYPIWSTEYGYWTNPPDPDRGSLPVATAAYYMNWAEYISYENPRIASYEQYQLVDPRGDDWTDGLFTSSGKPKATLAAYMLPLYLPTTSVSHASSLTVWGGVRPATNSQAYGQQEAEIQFAPKGSSTFATVQTVRITNARGYFDVHQTFSHSGTVRIAYVDPLASNGTVYSRSQTITVK
jgi:hypothetical protein